ncbi:curlin [Bizionia saleffrena]|nr:curlin [Bizionia saleffrena]
MLDNKDGSAISPTIATPLSQAPSSANAGESYQNGNDNKVWVRQAGTKQSVYTEQDNGLGTGNNAARIWQTGAVQATSGVKNAAMVKQLGTNNQSTTQQEGDKNHAVTQQGLKEGTLGVSENNRAKIRQGTGQQAEKNYASIEQDGANNKALTLQTYDNSEARTVQEGDNNKANINQNAGPNNSSGHSALVEQYGDFNESHVTQSGAGASNRSASTQTGNGNESHQTQVNTASGGGANANEAFINQGTVGNDGAIAQDATALYGDVSALDAVVGVGTFNGPGSYNALAIQNQNGESNQSSIFQFGADAPTDGNYAEQDVDGDNNDALIVQNNWGTSAGGNNYAKQRQDGDKNEAGLVQLGNDNKARQEQHGDKNYAMATQRGTANLLNTWQMGDKNAVTSAQRGHDNQILIVQRDGQSYVAEQNLNDAWSNGNNVIDVLQLGPNGNFATDGIDCGFETELDPSCPVPVPTFNIDAPCDGC